MAYACILHVMKEAVAAALEFSWVPCCLISIPPSLSFSLPLSQLWDVGGEVARVVHSMATYIVLAWQPQAGNIGTMLLAGYVLVDRHVLATTNTSSPHASP